MKDIVNKKEEEGVIKEAKKTPKTEQNILGNSKQAGLSRATLGKLAWIWLGWASWGWGWV